MEYTLDRRDTGTKMKAGVNLFDWPTTCHCCSFLFLKTEYKT